MQNRLVRVGLDARYVNDHFPGIGRYTANLAHALAELAPANGFQLVILHHPDLPNTRHDLSPLADQPFVELVAARAAPFSVAEQLLVPRLARRARLDLLHSPYYLKPYAGLPCPTVVTIHDLIGRRFPQTLPRPGRWLFKRLIWLAVHTSARIIAVSRHTRDDLAFAYRLQRHQIAVVPEAPDPRFRPQPAAAVTALRTRYRLPPVYVLYVGSNKPHKNLERLVRAWERVDRETPTHSDSLARYAQLVIAGHYDPRYNAARRMVAERNLGDRVRFLPDVAEADLPALYSGATLFVFPSFYEGFGLPPLEAMACGVPVICAYAASLPEVVGNAALTVDPYNFIEMAAALRRLLDNQVLRSHFRRAGLKHVQTFTWRRSAIATLAVYRSLTEHFGPKRV